jgi:hypothetical protein
MELQRQHNRIAASSSQLDGRQSEQVRCRVFSRNFT